MKINNATFKNRKTAIVPLYEHFTTKLFFCNFPFLRNTITAFWYTDVGLFEGTLYEAKLPLNRNKKGKKWNNWTYIGRCVCVAKTEFILLIQATFFEFYYQLKAIYFKYVLSKHIEPQNLHKDISPVDFKINDDFPRSDVEC